jgi:hypothetical protein
VRTVLVKEYDPWDGRWVTEEKSEASWYDVLLCTVLWPFVSVGLVVVGILSVLMVVVCPVVAAVMFFASLPRWLGYRKDEAIERGGRS